MSAKRLPSVGPRIVHYAHALRPVRPFAAVHGAQTRRVQGWCVAKCDQRVAVPTPPGVMHQAPSASLLHPIAALNRTRFMRSSTRRCGERYPCTHSPIMEGAQTLRNVHLFATINRARSVTRNDPTNWSVHFPTIAPAGVMSAAPSTSQHELLAPIDGARTLRHVEPLVRFGRGQGS